MQHIPIVNTVMYAVRFVKRVNLVLSVLTTHTDTHTLSSGTQGIF